MADVVEDVGFECVVLQCFSMSMYTWDDMSRLWKEMDCLQLVILMNWVERAPARIVGQMGRHQIFT